MARYCYSTELCQYDPLNRAVPGLKNSARWPDMAWPATLVSSPPLAFHRRLSTAPSSLPPPEWIDPYLDVSYLTHRHPGDPPLLPSPWLARVISLVLDPPPPSLEPSLDTFCHRFLLRLPPNFVFAALHHPDLRRCPISFLCFFHWATCQKNYPGHNLDSCVSLIDALSSFSPAESNQI